MQVNDWGTFATLLNLVIHRPTVFRRSFSESRSKAVMTVPGPPSLVSDLCRKTPRDYISVESYFSP